jgi:DnaJ-class molecular chaperone
MSKGTIDFDPTVDHYKVLGVDSKASADAIKKAFRKLAKQYHPDSTGGDKAKEARFKEISNAYDVLGDPKKRAQYDQIRANGFRPPGGGGPGFEGFSTGGMQGFDLGDLFGQFFGGGGRGGRVRVERFDFGGPDMRPPPPPAQDAEFESKVRAADGTWLDVKGVDIHSDARISFDRAIQGTVVEVATVDGKAKVKIPPGTSSGKKLRLRGKGATDGTGRVGDHYVTVHIDVPSGAEIDDDTRKQLVELAHKLKRTKR